MARNTKADGNSLRSVSTPAMQGKKGNVNSKGRSVTGGASMGGMNIRGAGGLGKSKPKNVEVVVKKYKKQVSSDRKAAAKERASMRAKGHSYESFLDFVNEEGYDRMRDDRLVKYGIGHDGADRKSTPSRSSGKKTKGKTNYQKQAEKEHGKGVTALDIVKKNIEKKHGKGAIMSTKKEEYIPLRSFKQVVSEEPVTAAVVATKAAIVGAKAAKGAAVAAKAGAGAAKRGDS